MADNHVQLRAALDEARNSAQSILNLARGSDEISVAHTFTTIAVVANDFLDNWKELFK
jgi:predicted GNAT family acetyltransferase